jgi:hypothetical protein
MNGTIRVRLVGVGVGWAMVAGAVAGFVPGLFVGCVLGAVISWAAGVILDWQRQLGFTLGVTQQLLPFGDQVQVLEQLVDGWPVVIPAVGVMLGLLWALIGTLAFGVLASLLSRSRIGVPLEVELEEGFLTGHRD